MELTRRKSTRVVKEEQFIYEPIKLNIVLEKEGETHWPLAIKEILNRNQHNEINIKEIIQSLKKQNFNDFFEASVSYYHNEKEIYIFCFFLPRSVTQEDLAYNLKYQKWIPYSAFSEKDSEIYLKIKFRKKNKTRLELLKEELKSKYNEKQSASKASKQKQKLIGEVVEKVALWRKIYSGFSNETDTLVQKELDLAASQVGIIKKTLDDYLLQIRCGKKYGFNFHNQKDSKIGELRTFVREKKQELGKK